ncbi:MAG: hypothetical protein HKUEN01_34360 [Candidatus Kuenenia stuttgartiensis]|jgi:hypothetical protein|nr:MAG: hypothetical protein HKUEN01_34360 [Candidatus Kuenenia stuttgartiensis]
MLAKTTENTFVRKFHGLMQIKKTVLSCLNRFKQLIYHINVSFYVSGSLGLFGGNYLV